MYHVYLRNVEGHRCVPAAIICGIIVLQAVYGSYSLLVVWTMTV